MEGRGVDIEDQRGPGLLGLPGSAPDPDVFTDAKRYRDASNIDHRRACAGLEIALLVEDAVVWEVLFAVGGDDSSGTHKRAGIEQSIVFPQGVTDDKVNARYGLLELLERGLDLPPKTGPQYQVLRGITGQGQFREGDEIGPDLIPSLASSRYNPLGVAGNISHHEI